MKQTAAANQQPPLRLILLQGEVRRLSEPWTEIQIRAGKAWLTIDGQDVFLQRGQRFVVVSAKDFGLISATGHTPLIVEISRVETRQVTSSLGALILRRLTRRPIMKVEDLHARQPR